MERVKTNSSTGQISCRAAFLALARRKTAAARGRFLWFWGRDSGFL